MEFGDEEIAQIDVQTNETMDTVFGNCSAECSKLLECVTFTVNQTGNCRLYKSLLERYIHTWEWETGDPEGKGVISGFRSIALRSKKFPKG